MKSRRLAALGSWFGDDRIAWVLLEGLKRSYRQAADLEYVACDRSGLEWLHGERPWQLILIDAVHSHAEPGSVHRLEYPDAGLSGDVAAPCSAHGLALQQGLALARSLDRLPHQVLFWGVEIVPGSRSDRLSTPLAGKVPQLTALLANELGLEPATC